jgi:hypothetical protein
MPIYAVHSSAGNPTIGRQHTFSIVPAPPCPVKWSINGDGVTVHDKEAGLEVVGASSILVVNVSDDVEGRTIIISATLECDDLIKVSPLQIDMEGEKPMSAEEIFFEGLKSLGIPLTFPYWLLMLILFLIFKALKKIGVTFPNPDDIKKHLDEIGHLLPDWLRNILDLH